jgi:hypothetical protein
MMHIKNNPDFKKKSDLATIFRTHFVEFERGYSFFSCQDQHLTIS